MCEVFVLMLGIIQSVFRMIEHEITKPCKPQVDDDSDSEPEPEFQEQREIQISTGRCFCLCKSLTCIPKKSKYVLSPLAIQKS